MKCFSVCCCVVLMGCSSAVEVDGHPIHLTEQKIDAQTYDLSAASTEILALGRPRATEARIVSRKVISARAAELCPSGYDVLDDALIDNATVKQRIRCRNG
jgi:hypothetical protein